MSDRILLIDMDNTIADFDGALKEQFNKQFPSLKWDETRLSFRYPSEIGKECRQIMCQQRFFGNLKPIAGAIQAIKEISMDGWNIFFCTSPLRQYQYCVPEKYEWIEKHFGHEWICKIITSKDKTLVCGDYLIDDKVQTGMNNNPIWTQILFDQPYNRNETTFKRITHWNKWRDILVKTDD